MMIKLELSLRRLSLFLLVALAAVPVQANRPNVLFLAVDDMRDWVGCLGGYPGVIHTPNIAHFGDGQCALVKSMPRSAKRSMFGV